MKELENLSQEELAEKLLQQGSALHMSNKTAGTLLPDVINFINGSNHDAAKKLSDAVVMLDPKIYNRDNIIQKILLSRILVVRLMNMSVTTGANVNNLLVLCDTTLADDVWVDSITQTVIPALIASNFL